MSALTPYSSGQDGYNRYFLEPPSEECPKGKESTFLVHWFKHLVVNLSDADLGRLSQTNSVLYRVILDLDNRFEKFKLKIAAEIERTPINSSHLFYLVEQDSSPRAQQICKKAILEHPHHMVSFRVQVAFAKQLLTHDADLAMIRIQELFTSILDSVDSMDIAEFLEGGGTSLVRLVLGLNAEQIQNLIAHCEQFPETESKKLIVQFMQMMLQFKNAELCAENVDDEISQLHSYLVDNLHVFVDSDTIPPYPQHILLGLDFYCWALTKKDKLSSSKYEFFREALYDTLRNRIPFNRFTRDKNLVVNIRDILLANNVNSMSSIFSSLSYSCTYSEIGLILYVVAYKDSKVAYQMISKMIRNLISISVEPIENVLQEKWDEALNLFEKDYTPVFHYDFLLRLIQQSPVDWMRKNCKRFCERHPNKEKTTGVSILVALADRLDQVSEDLQKCKEVTNHELHDR